MSVSPRPRSPRSERSHSSRRRLEKSFTQPCHGSPGSTPSQGGSTVCLPGSAGSSDGLHRRLLSHHDLNNFEEQWGERCMFEVKKLEDCILEKIEQLESKIEHLESKQERQIRKISQQQESQLRTLEESQDAAWQKLIDAMDASFADIRKECNGYLQCRNEHMDPNQFKDMEEKLSLLEAAQKEQAQVMREQAAGLYAEHNAGMQEVYSAMEATKYVAATCQRLCEAAAHSSGEQANLLQGMEAVARQFAEAAAAAEEQASFTLDCADSDFQFHDISNLQGRGNRPNGVDPKYKELRFADGQFKEVLGMIKEDDKKLSAWKKKDIKQKHNLF